MEPCNHAACAVATLEAQNVSRFEKAVKTEVIKKDPNDGFNVSILQCMCVRT